MEDKKTRVVLICPLEAYDTIMGSMENKIQTEIENILGEKIELIPPYEKNYKKYIQEEIEKKSLIHVPVDFLALYDNPNVEGTYEEIRQKGLTVSYNKEYKNWLDNKFAYYRINLDTSDYAAFVMILNRNIPELSKNELNKEFKYSLRTKKIIPVDLRKLVNEQESTIKNGILDNTNSNVPKTIKFKDIDKAA